MCLQLILLFRSLHLCNFQLNVTLGTSLLLFLAFALKPLGAAFRMEEMVTYRNLLDLHPLGEILHAYDTFSDIIFITCNIIGINRILNSQHEFLMVPQPYIFTYLKLAYPVLFYCFYCPDPVQLLSLIDHTHGSNTAETAY